ncbi:hypothetical protein GCM10019016_099540 [Streptomyces prasinosporus]|uniref:Uncharacterized protein n=1 Tax=Streptomyces prasinosporus TaxID=68256 RepID=A0ABP6U6Q8_9ACTN
MNPVCPGFVPTDADGARTWPAPGRESVRRRSRSRPRAASPGPAPAVRRSAVPVPLGQTKALCPVIAFPTISVFISLVPSKE